ncbi:type II toxin-antitoxin system VapC family toxin [Candidatus Gottesmanbacteria bacterium]|nr:type II toxin-antitoxin system VapC family toxin [Candidatus Gottesmanbacteria bacterium]
MKKQVVVDASVMVKWLRSEKEQLLDKANKLLKDFQQGKIELYAPELAKYEVGNVLVKRKLVFDEVKTSLATYYAIPINFIPETKELAKEAYRFSNDLNITYYDGTYLSLAKEINAILVTENIKHLGKTTEVKVRSLANYI